MGDYQVLSTAIEPLESGLLDSISQSLGSLDTGRWGSLAKKVAVCQSCWKGWYAIYVQNENFIMDDKKWKGKGVWDYQHFSQTVAELCSHVEALDRWTVELSNASASLNAGKDVVITVQDPMTTTTTKTFREARVETAKRIFKVACGIANCQRFKDLMTGKTKTVEQLKETETNTTAAVVAEMHSDFYSKVLGEDLGLTKPDALERYLRDFLPRSIIEAVGSAKKDKAAPTNVPQPDPAESSEEKKDKKKMQLPGATEEILGGQAA